jgi:hypothetical protein
MAWKTNQIVIRSILTDHRKNPTEIIYELVVLQTHTELQAWVLYCGGLHIEWEQIRFDACTRMHGTFQTLDCSSSDHVICKFIIAVMLVIFNLKISCKDIWHITNTSMPLDDRSSRVRFSVELGIFLFTTASRTTLGPTQPPIQWVTGGSFPGGKVAGAWSWPLTSI